MIVKSNNGFKVALTNMVAIGKEVQFVIGSIELNELKINVLDIIIDNINYNNFTLS